MCYTKEGALKDRREMLKVKVKSLADEARIIRHAEGKTHGELRGELRWHRVSSVRLEARASHLAYGLIRGLPLARIENSKMPRPWEKVKAMIQKYGPVDGAARATLLAQCAN
jgi:hypothetical protein